MLVYLNQFFMHRLGARTLYTRVFGNKNFQASISTHSNVVPSKPCLGILPSRFSMWKGLKVKAMTPFFIRFRSVTASSSLVPKDTVQQVDFLKASDDSFGGVIVDMKDPMDSNVFAPLLRASISKWRQQGKKGIWIKLPIGLVNLAEAAVKEGFWYHHAEPTYLMLVYWIPNTAHTLPANASHRVGIGAFVMNNQGEVLVVQETSGKFKDTGVWKFPTGVVDEGEDICAAAIREVKEEAGIETEFVEVLAFRQSHMSFFGKSDLFCVCMLRPMSFNIQKQNSEIDAAQWMPVEEYAAQPFVQKHELFNYVAKICIAKKDNNYTGFSAVSKTTGFSAKQNYLYFNSRDLEQSLTSDNQH